MYGDMRSFIGTMSLNPTLAYKINSQLTLGMQINIGYGKAEIDLPVFVKNPGPEGPGFSRLNKIQKSDRSQNN